MLRIAAMLIIAVPVATRADLPGGTLLEYRSSSMTTPLYQAWVVESDCLRGDCPGVLDNAPGGIAGPCYWQGARDVNTDGFVDNTCTLGVGCRKNGEHYNAPAATLNVEDSCSSTEWMVFDNGDTVSGRSLTIVDAAAGPPNSVRVVQSPPFGANSFPGAPQGHAPLRLSVGSGSDLGQVLPVDEPENARNGGRLGIRTGTFLELPPGVHDVTALAIVAFGPWARQSDDIFLEVRVPSTSPGRHWRFALTPPNSIDGHPGENAIGIVNHKLPDTAPLAYAFGGLNVRKYNTQSEVWTGGGFHHIRIICRADGTFSLFKDENPTNPFNGSLGTPGVDDLAGEASELLWGILDDTGGAGCTTGCGKTIWFDAIGLYPGAVLPTNCPDPVFDTDEDDDVDRDDFSRAGPGWDFLDCATGPAPSVATFAGLADACRCLDVNDDQAVDQADFAVFQRCLSGSGNTADPNCDD